MSDQQAVFVKMALNAWDSYINRADKLFSSLSDAELKKEVAPGKNRAVYLLGHLVAVNDGIIPIFALGERLYPQLEALYVSKPDRSGQEEIPIAQLREYWAKVNETLSNYFSQMQPEDWFKRHTLMTDEDLVKEPHRNKLSVLINRTNHVAWHYGQVLLVK